MGFAYGELLEPEEEAWSFSVSAAPPRLLIGPQGEDVGVGMYVFSAPSSSFSAFVPGCRKQKSHLLFTVRKGKVCACSPYLPETRPVKVFADELDSTCLPSQSAREKTENCE